MPTMQYVIGTVAVTNSSQTVTGTDTLWDANVSVGDIFKTGIDGDATYVVGSVDSDTQITLSSNYAGSTDSGLSYAIQRDFSANLSYAMPNQGDAGAMDFIREQFINKLDTDLGQVVNPASSPSFAGLTVDTDTLYVDSANNRVGIGTDSPAVLLDVKITDSAGTYFTGAASSDGGSRGLSFTSSDSGIYLGAIHTINATSANGEIALATGSVEKVRIDSSGNVGIDETNPTISDGIGLHIGGKILRLATSKTPASAGATGNQGEICWDSGYMYVCIATDTWERAALASW